LPSPFTVPTPPGDKVPGVTQRNIEAVTQLEQEFSRQRTLLDRVSDRISAFVGSVQFVLAHAGLILAWVLLNTALPAASRFDPYPFVFLNLVLAVETVFLSTFVLMSQNRQNHQADRWAHLDLQVSLLAEQEATKMLQMLGQISDHLGLKQPARDRELHDMVKTTHVEVLVDELDQARENAKDEAAQGEAKEGAKPEPGPDKAGG
jgi:uncharacterized membrane protein